MKKNYIIFSILTYMTWLQATAQCPMASAVSDVTLNCTGGTANRTGVAYNPLQSKYYSVVAGTTSYPIETFNVTGGNAIASTTQGADYRGLWWNSITSTIEGNTYANGGIYRHDLSAGLAAGTVSNVAPSTMPNTQSMGHADIPNNIILHYNSGTLYKYVRSTGVLISSMAITGLPAGFGNLNTYGVAYCGVQGGEAVLYDYINKAAYFVNYNTGAYLATCTLPASAPAAQSYQMGYANSRLFLYSSATSQWFGYPIVSNSAVAPVASPPAVCNGATVVLTNTASATASYTWSSGAQNTSITVSPSVTTSYTVTGTSTAGCTASVVITVTVNGAVPSLTVVPTSTSVCLGQTVALTASGALSYSWNNNVSNGVSFSPSVTSNYIVSGQNGCGTTTASINLPVAPLQVLASTPSTVVCANAAVPLTATAAATNYTWLPVNFTGSNIAVIPQTAGSSFTVIASNGQCNGSAVISLVVNPSPTISVVPSSTAVCDNQSFTLTASGASTYTWGQGGGNGSTAVFTQTTNSIYSVNGTNSFGCSAGGSYGVISIPPPVLNLSASQTLACKGSVITLTASGNSTTWFWSNGSNTPSVSVTPNTSITFTCMGGNSANCTTTKTIAITVLTPTVSISATSVVCLGNTATLTASGTGTFSWIGFNAPSIVVTPSVQTTYTVTASTKSLNVTCSSTFTSQVNVNALPATSVAATRTAICKNEKTTLTASGAGSYLWSTNSTSTSIVYTGGSLGNFVTSVTGTDNNGCSSTASITLKVSSCNGIDENSAAASVLVYPVPSSGDITIVVGENIQVHITDLTGKNIGTYDLNESNQRTVQLKGLAAGVYMISSVDGNFNRKVLVTQ